MPAPFRFESAPGFITKTPFTTYKTQELGKTKKKKDEQPVGIHRSGRIRVFCGGEGKKKGGGG